MLTIFFLEFRQGYFLLLVLSHHFKIYRLSEVKWSAQKHLGGSLNVTMGSFTKSPCRSQSLLACCQPRSHSLPPAPETGRVHHMNPFVGWNKDHSKKKCPTVLEKMPWLSKKGLPSEVGFHSAGDRGCTVQELMKEGAGHREQSLNSEQSTAPKI